MGARRREVVLRRSQEDGSVLPRALAVALGILNPDLYPRISPVVYQAMIPL